MTAELADEVLRAELALKQPTPNIWPQTYLTGAATHDSLWLFGGSFRAVRRARIPASSVSGVSIRTVEFPTRTVTRHFPALVIGVNASSQELQILPLRTALMIVRKLRPEQLAAAARDLAHLWHVDLS